jgi:hypothetical protein
MKKILHFIKTKPKRSAVFGIILFIIIFSIAKKHGDNPGIVSYTVTRGDVVDSLELAGRVEPVESAEMAFTESGQVSRVYKKNGDTVKSGEKIIELDNASLYAELKDANANLALVRGETNVSNAELDRDVENARIELLSSDLTAYTKDNENTSSAPQISGRYNSEAQGEYIIDIEYSNNSSHRAMRFYGLEKGTQDILFYKAVPLGTKGLYIKFPDTVSVGENWRITIPNVEGASYVSNLGAYKRALASRDAELQTNVSSEISEAKIAQAQAKVDRIRSEINA